MTKWFQLALACGLCAFTAGCGGGGVSVDGKVTKGGAPYTLAEGEKISVTLVSEDGKTTAGGDVQPDGSFQVKSATGGGVPVGKYKVSYTHYHAPVAGKSAGSPPTRQVPEAWEVTTSPRPFTLEIGGTAKK